MKTQTPRTKQAKIIRLRYKTPFGKFRWSKCIGKTYPITKIAYGLDGKAIYLLDMGKRKGIRIWYAEEVQVLKNKTKRGRGGKKQ